MTVLVTGGAGYIGSHVVRLLRMRGEDVCIIDDLSSGDRARVPQDVSLVEVDLTSDAAIEQLRKVMRGERVDAVIHFAAKKRVGESVERPTWYYRENVGGLTNVVTAMTAEGIVPLVFSSSAAVYGEARGAAIQESDRTEPVNPYGWSKLFGERVVADAATAGEVKATSLRYFNVAGAGWDDLGDHAVLNLVPMVFERLQAGESPLIFGDDYDTPDGTCIRDYVHVLDLAEAHLEALDGVRHRSAGHRVYNVGTGKGTSVREMISAIAGESGIDIPPVVVDRRQGDPPAVVASVDLIHRELGWSAQRGLKEIVSSAWAARAGRAS